MLKLDTQQYLQAAATMARALDHAETEGGFKTFSGRVCAILDALGNEFDVSPMDPGADVAVVTCGCYLANPMRQEVPGDPAWFHKPGCAFYRDDQEEVWSYCAHCESGDHTTEEHRSALSQRVINEMDQYNRDVFES
jgi:hypothetical protein